MREIQPLEERIRARARKQLDDEINAAADALARYAHFGYSVDSTMLSNESKPLQLWEAIGVIKKRIYKELVTKREDDAIADFIEKVDRLQAEVDELKAIQG